jgi:hypothetical protein
VSAIALGQATLGVHCPNKALGQASLGVFCGEVIFGGNQFLVFKPILDAIKTQLPIDASIVQYEQISDTEFEIDGKQYGLIPRRTPEDVIKGVKDVEKIIAKAAREAGVSNDKAREELYNRILEELKTVEEFKKSVFNDDEEIIMILIATDAL